MPLLDHFHPPLSNRRHWEGLHSAWANELCRQLNERLPSRYFAEARVHHGGRIEVDVATFDAQWASAGQESEGGIAVWAPPRPSRVAAASFTDPDVFEVQVIADEGGPRLTAAIEVISPANKDRPNQRHAFAVTCASYLQQGIGLVIVDAVAARSADLHRELMDLLQVAETHATGDLFACAYRTVFSDPSTRVELWLEELAVGRPLPNLPLWFRGDECLPLDLEPAYAAACHMLRIS